MENEQNINEIEQAIEPITKPTEYISVDDMAHILSIARATAYQLTKTEGFPCFYIGKRIIIPLHSLHLWAEEQAREQSVLFAQ
ncbi:MAG: helix-turn-helix domain-containing protein [Oscillospiraceae bacterium]|nr:helix-turn-helix domain-containing protein [Oscillospiraceae bacterium]MCL2279489.1 helix-turn-helix domain-containing protein [Oscillospiraceae bacterium]